MRNASAIIRLIFAYLVIAAGQVYGLIEFKDGGTHEISGSYQSESIYVDYQAPGMGTTVIMNDGLLGGLHAFNSGRAEVWGATVDGLSASDTSDVAIFSGIANSIFACDSSHLTVIGNALNTVATDNSQVTLGGFLSSFFAEGSSQVTMSGGNVDEFYARDDSRITITDGYLCDLFASGNSRITMTGGWLEENPFEPKGELYASNNARITFYGSNFAIDGIPFGGGEIKSLGGSSNYNDEPFRRLSGTLTGGQNFDYPFRILDDAAFFIIPEPATLLLFGLGAIFIRKCKV